MNRMFNVLWIKKYAYKTRVHNNKEPRALVSKEAILSNCQHHYCKHEKRSPAREYRTSDGYLRVTYKNLQNALLPTAEMMHHRATIVTIHCQPIIYSCSFR